MIGRILRSKYAFAAASLLTALAARADETAAGSPPRAALSDLLTDSGLTTSGYIAASYYRSSGYPENLHQFDVRHDTFQLDQAGISIAYQPKEGFGALLDVIAGEDARLLHQAENEDDNDIDVKQAYLQYAGGPLMIIAGKFVTLAGAEVISPTLNSNFSRSLLFFENEPLTHTGVRAKCADANPERRLGSTKESIFRREYRPLAGRGGLCQLRPQRSVAPVP